MDKIIPENLFVLNLTVFDTIFFRKSLEVTTELVNLLRTTNNEQRTTTMNQTLFVYGGQVNQEFVKYTAELTGKAKPRICFLPTATGQITCQVLGEHRKTRHRPRVGRSALFCLASETNPRRKTQQPPLRNGRK